MTIMNRSAFKKQLQEGINANFGLEYGRHPEQWRDIFEVSTSNKAYEEDVLLVGLGAAQAKAEGKAGSYDAGWEAWTARYVNETIVIHFAVTEEAIEDNLYGNLSAKYSKSAARSMKHTKDVKGANILNNGFSTSFAIGDGAALFSTSHPLSGGGTFANTFTTQADLAEASIEDALVAISQYVDDRGLPIATMGKRLIIPPALMFVANRLLESAGRPGTNDNDVNALRNMGMLPGGAKVNQRLTDPNAWFITTDCPDGFKHFVRKGISKTVEADFETGNYRCKFRERYAFGLTDPRGGFGSSGGS